MGSMNYIIPRETMTLSDQLEYRRNAVKRGYQRAIDKSIGDRADLMEVLAPGSKKPKAQSVDVREFQPILDAAAALDQWNTAALAVVGTAYSCFQAVAAPVLAANKLAVFYRVQIETIPLPVSRLIFRSGAATGNILAEFDLEQLACEQVLCGYFSEPVVIDPTTTFAAQVLCRIATGVLARIQLGALVFEPAGSLIA